MRLDDPLLEERRARMAAERLLAQKQAELNEANRKLSRHAVALSEDLVETRGVVAAVRGDLEKATEEVSIAKRRLWDSIEAIEDGFAVYDAGGHLVICNAAYLAPFDGLECVRPGAHYDEVIDTAIWEGVIDLEGRTPAGWRQMMLDRWARPSPEGLVLKLWNGVYVRMVDTRAPGGDTVSLGIDITREIRREHALKEARNRAEAASRAKSAFLANMSHEIRTPMNGVVAMADLIADSDLSREQRLYVDTIRSSGEALLAIINDVLDYSKIEASKLELRPEPLDLEKLILDIILLLQPSIREKGLKVMLDYDLFLPTCYRGDPVRLRQVLTNLIGNAVKFTHEGHVLVRVVGLPLDGEEVPTQRIHVTVEDTGIGIAPEMQSQVFGEFTQVEAERNRAYEGTGLGLAISRQLITLMGGTLWVESEEGVGSCFGLQVALPVVQGACQRQAAVPGWIRSALVVMADDLHRTILAKRLVALGITVEVTDSAQDALRMRPADVAFADDRLADMALDAFIVALGAQAPVPVFVLSSAIGAAPDLGDIAAAILPKPLARPDLLDVLEQLPQPRPDTPDEGEADASLPATPPLADTAGDAAAPPLPPAAPATPALRAMRVLAAEDNKTNRLVFSKLVKTCDIDLTFAENGSEAVAAYAAQPPDLVFMDISMPGMDGKEATRRIRALEAQQGWPRCRIVALTAHALDGDSEEILAAGLDLHLTKPLRRGPILDEIAAAAPPEARAPLAALAATS